MKIGRKNRFYYIIKGTRYNSAREAAEAYSVSVQSISNWCGDGPKAKPDCRKLPKESTQSISQEKKKSDTEKHETAFDYLRACACGEISPDPLRIAAAKSILPYEKPRSRIKPESPSDKVLRKKQEQAIERDNLLKFEKKAKEVRKKYGCQK
jgi:hypothetical protein